MTSNLALELTDASGSPKTVIASKNDKATFEWMPEKCATDGACALNSNTVYGSTKQQYYYNWYAATAGFGAIETSNIDVDTSICSRGWKIPSNYTIVKSMSYGLVTNMYGMTTDGANNRNNNVAKLEVFPLNFGRNGYYERGTLLTVGDAHYWSSTTTSVSGAYYLNYNGNFTYPQRSDYNYKYYGFNIRCVAL